MQNKRYFFEISYNGISFHGWQIQKNALGIQQVIEEAFSQIFNHNISIIASGRTDAGVHAKQQFFHTDIPASIFEKFEIKNINKCPFQTLIFKLNCMLSKHIAVHHIYSVKTTNVKNATNATNMSYAPNFNKFRDTHARFSAIQRQYKYYIHSSKDVFLNGLSVYYKKTLDLVAMNEACRYLIGEKNFKSFSQTHTQVEHYNCDLVYAQWSKKGNNYMFEIHANRFLRGMVRNIVGTLVAIGRGDSLPQTIIDILNAKDRQKAGNSFPAHGLYLTKVVYPKGSLNKIFEKN